MRSAAAVEAPRGTNSDLFFDGPMDDSYGGAIGEIMEPPAEDLFVMPPLDTAGPTPGSIGGTLPGSVQFTPPSLGGLTDGLPDLAGGLTGPSTAAEGRHGESPEEGGTKQRKKKRVQVDVGPDGLAATQMPPEEIRKLLNDRSSLLKRRGLTRDATTAPGASGPEAPPRVFDIRAQSEAANESFMYRPACTNRLDPELLAVFNRALGVSEDGKIPAAAAGRRGNAAAAAGANAATNPAPFDTSPADGAGAFGGADMPQPSYSGGASPAPSWGGFDDGGGPAMSDGFEPDYIENSQDDGAMPMAGRAGGSGAAPLDFLTSTRDDSLRVSLGGFGDEDNADGTTPGGGATSEEGGVAGAGGLASDGFTARTKVVLEHLAYRFVGPTSGVKRRHPGSASTPTPLVESLPLDGFVGGRNRLEACRWFFEALVLRNKSYVDLKQSEPYGEISIIPLDKLMQGQYLAGEEPARSAGTTGVARQRRATTPVSEAA